MPEGEEHPADSHGVLRGEGCVHEQGEPEGTPGQTGHRLSQRTTSLRGWTAFRGKCVLDYKYKETALNVVTSNEKDSFNFWFALDGEDSIILCLTLFHNLPYFDVNAQNI